MSAVETNLFNWALNDPRDQEAVANVIMRRKLLARLFSNKWFGLAGIGIFAVLVFANRNLQTWFSAALLAALVLGWVSSATSLLSFRKAGGFRKRASPETPRFSRVVGLLPDGVTVASPLLPDRLIPWTTLDLMEREGDRLVLLFKLAPLVPLERLVVPEHAFSDAEDFSNFCSAAASFAARAGKARLYVA